MATANQLVSLGAKVERQRTLPSDGLGPKIYMETYGCQMNVADSALIAGALADKGYVKASEASAADVILINTCAVREKAEERVVARAKELASFKKEKKVVLAIAGCMAEHLKESLAQRAPDVDVIAGPDSYRRLPDLLEEARLDTKEGALFVDVKLDKGEVYDGLNGMSEGDGVSGFVSIQRGCDKFCTFCVVPFTRGRERGVPPREILRHVRSYAERGYKEVNLLGQTVNSYKYEDVNFATLLNKVASIDGIERIRFTSPYPVDFTDEVIEVIASNPKICNHLHLPFQSGSDAVLTRMKRGYTRQDVIDLVGKIRKAVPDIGFSTDVLSGFCGESEDDHLETLSLIKELRFDSAFMFSYSERELTYASKKIEDDVDPKVKKKRLQDIIKAQTEISKEKFAAKVGSVQKVLIHENSKRDDMQWKGRTDDFKSVIFDKPQGSKPGDLVDVQIESSSMATLLGSAV